MAPGDTNVGSTLTSWNDVQQRKKNTEDDDTGSAQIQYGTSHAYGARIGGYLGVHLTTVYRLIGDRSCRISGRLRLAFNREEIER